MDKEVVPATCRSVSRKPVWILKAIPPVSEVGTDLIDNIWHYVDEDDPAFQIYVTKSQGGFPNLSRCFLLPRLGKSSRINPPLLFPMPPPLPARVPRPWGEVAEVMNQGFAEVDLGGHGDYGFRVVAAGLQFAKDHANPISPEASKTKRQAPWTGSFVLSTSSR